MPVCFCPRDPLTNPPPPRFFLGLTAGPSGSVSRPSHRRPEPHMKRILLLTAALCTQLVFAGCDAAGPDSSTSTAGLRTAEISTGDGVPEARAITTDRLDAYETATTPHSSTPTADVKAPISASRGASGSFTYTAVSNPTPQTPPSDATVKTVGGISPPGGGGQNLPPPPCDPGEPGGNPEGNDPNCDPGGGNPWYPNPPPPPGPAALVAYDSFVQPQGHNNASVVASSQVVDANGRPTPIDFMWIAATTTDNGNVLGNGTLGAPNVSSLALFGNVPRPRSGQINLCQGTAHRFVITDSTGTHDNTYTDSECQIWN